MSTFETTRVHVSPKRGDWWMKALELATLYLNGLRQVDIEVDECDVVKNWAEWYYEQIVRGICPNITGCQRPQQIEITDNDVRLAR